MKRLLLGALLAVALVARARVTQRGRGHPASRLAPRPDSRERAGRPTARQPVTLKRFSFSQRGAAVLTDAPADSLVLTPGRSRTVNVTFVPVNDTESSGSR